MERHRKQLARSLRSSAASDSACYNQQLSEKLTEDTAFGNRRLTLTSAVGYSMRNDHEP
jgi:hypothetical protein